LDDDVIVGGLGIDVGNADLAVLEIEILDAFLNGLKVLVTENQELRERTTYTTTDRNRSYLCLQTRNKLGPLPVKELETY